MLKVVRKAISIAFLAALGPSAGTAGTLGYEVFVQFGTAQVFLPAYTGTADVTRVRLEQRLKVLVGPGTFECSRTDPCFGSASVSMMAVDPYFDRLNREVSVLRTPKCRFDDVCVVHGNVGNRFPQKGDNSRISFGTNGDPDFGKAPLELSFLWERDGKLPGNGFAHFYVVYFDTSSVPLPAGLPLLGGSFGLLATVRLLTKRQKRLRASATQA